jgi:capsular polysaccharide biosynthesis protein
MGRLVGIPDLLRLFQKRIKLFISILVVSVMLAAIYSFLLATPVYRASTMFLVNQAQPERSINYNEIQTNLELINTYRVIIKSPIILDEVIQQLNLEMESDALNEHITIFNENNSQVFTINVRQSNPKMAATIANTIADVFQDVIPQIMNVNNVNILSEANVEKAYNNIISPKPKLNLLLGVFAGLITAVGTVLILEYIDNSIETEEDIERVLDIPIIGVIPVLDKVPKQKSKG